MIPHQRKIDKLMVVGCFGHGRFNRGHTPLDVLAKENIQGGYFPYILFFWQMYIIQFNVIFVNTW